MIKYTKNIKKVIQKSKKVYIVANIEEYKSISISINKKDLLKQIKNLIIETYTYIIDVKGNLHLLTTP